VPRSVAESVLQQTERVGHGGAADPRAPEIAVAPLQMTRLAVPLAEAEMHQPDRLLGAPAAGALAAIARATASLTAPCRRIRSMGTPIASAFASFE